MELTIRDERPADAEAIENLTIAAFREAPHADGTEHRIVSALRRTGRLTVSLVAEEGEEIVGHVAVSPVAVSDGSAGWYGLGPISVTPGRQREGIGSLLMTRALDELRGLGARGCVVLGDPSYYGRFGFRAEPGLVLPGVPPEYFQALAFRGPLPSGSVEYDEAFAAPD